MSDKDSSGVSTPPPVVYLVCILAGLGLDYLWPLPFFPQIIRYAGGSTIIVLSFILFGLVLREFSKSNTSIDHKKSTTEIISSGPFRYSRHPVYLSLTLLAIGIAFVTDSLWVVVMTVPAVLVIHYFVILKEERYLENKFGDEYRSYMASVRRWI